MLIRVDKHLDLPGPVRLAATLLTAGAALVADLALVHPAVNDEGTMVFALILDRDVPISLTERKCPEVQVGSHLAVARVDAPRHVAELREATAGVP